jgi:hypothetical protein
MISVQKLKHAFQSLIHPSVIRFSSALRTKLFAFRGNQSSSSRRFVKHAPSTIRRRSHLIAYTQLPEKIKVITSATTSLYPWYRQNGLFSSQLRPSSLWNNLLLVMDANHFHLSPGSCRRPFESNTGSGSPETQTQSKLMSIARLFQTPFLQSIFSPFLFNLTVLPDIDTCARAPLILHGRQMPRLLYHHNRLLARADSCHLWRLLNCPMSTHRWQSPAD